MVTIYHLPLTPTFDPVNCRSSLCTPYHHPKSAIALSNIPGKPGDLAHISQIILDMVFMAHPQLWPPVTPPHPHTASFTSSMLLPPRNMPSKLSQFLSYMETHLGIENTHLHKDSLHTLGFGPDILHLVEDNVLKDIGFIPGDVIYLKQSVWQWWSTNAKHKQVSHITSPLAQLTPPNKRVRFKKQFHDGGCYCIWFMGPRWLMVKVPLILPSRLTLTGITFIQLRMLWCLCLLAMCLLLMMSM